MSIATTREQRRQLERDNAKLPAELTEIPRDQWPATASADTGRQKVWRSRAFLVQQFEAPEPALCRLSINRTTLAGERWADGLDWDTLQAIKAEVGFAFATAVEIFPPVTEVVNVANLRHLWVLPAMPEYAWRRASRG